MRSNLRGRIAAGAALLFSVLGCDDGAKPPPADPPIDSELALVQALERAYERKDDRAFAALLSQDESAPYLYLPSEPIESVTGWDAETEILIHRRMFRGAAPGERPVPDELRLVSITVDIDASRGFYEAPYAYRDPIANPDGLDPARWRASEAGCSVYILLNTQGQLDYVVTGRAALLVIEDRTKGEREPGRFLLLRWYDLGSPGAAGGQSGDSWARIKALYARASTIDSEPALIEALASAYRGRDFDAYAGCLTNARGVDFAFFPYAAGSPDAPWDRYEELQIHRRMFQPQSTSPQVPPELWLDAIDIALTPRSSFQENTEYYADPASGRPGLNRWWWRISEARYGSHVLFDTRGPTNYLAEGIQRFVVVADRHKLAGVPGKFALYHWQDLGPVEPAVSVEARTWSSVKELYRR